MEHRRRILIDTSILIEYFRKEDKKKSLFFKHFLKYNLAISTITEFEFMSGLNPKNREFLHKIIENLLVLPFDSACAKIAAEIYRNL